MSDQDLPLLSNIRDIRARHYLIDLQPDLCTKVIQGRLFIFFEPTTSCENRGKCCTRDCLCPDITTQNLRNITTTPDQEFQLQVNRENKVSSPYKGNESTVKTQYRVESNSFDVDDESEIKEDFEVVLDCCDICVRSINEVSCEGCDLERFLHPQFSRDCKFAINFWSSQGQEPLQYSVSPWCIRIWKEGVKSVERFPQVVCITYETTPQGKSLMWRKDHDGNPCVFTPAAAINNRSLLPCQDPPSAMATWQAWITVNKEFYVSMTGDNQPVQHTGVEQNYVGHSAMLPEKNNYCCLKYKSCQNSAYHRTDFVESNVSTVCFYYYTTMVLPIATIAIAVGKWETTVIPAVSLTEPCQRVENSEDKTKYLPQNYPCHHYEYPCHMKPRHWNGETLLTAVYPLSSKSSVKPLISFLPSALNAAISLLGIYPCRRLELVILPACFGSLGLASPNLIFLSPTVVLDDPAAYIRLAHEISHAWFGINIGAQDWTEEWLSEGFATYMEDLVYAEAILADQRTSRSIRHHSQNCHEKRQTDQEDAGDCKRPCTGLNTSKPDDNTVDYKQGGGIILVQQEKFFNDSGKGVSNKIVEPLGTQGNSRSVKSNILTLPKERTCQTDKCPCVTVVYSKTNIGQGSARSGRFNYTSQNLEELSQLRAHLRYRTIVSELQYSAEELQILRPMQGERLEDPHGVNYVKNGLNPEKTFLQVHYLKGYFLLKYLSRLVGQAEFNAMIKEFVSLYHGQLVLSQHVLDHFIKTFPQVLERKITQELLYDVWLHQPGLNEEIKEMYGNISSHLVSEVKHHLNYWIQLDKLKNRPRQGQKMVNVQLDSFLFSDQLVLLLEYLLELPKLGQRTLRQLNIHYSIKAQCGDIRHRWCELVIKHNHEDLSEVERFLLKDQSMGVYLYGELVISRKAKHKRLAERAFGKVRQDMDENARLTVLSMLYGETVQDTARVNHNITP